MHHALFLLRLVVVGEAAATQRQPPAGGVQEWRVDVAVAVGGARYQQEAEATDAWSAGKSTAGARALRLESSAWVPIAATGRRSLGAAADPVNPPPPFSPPSRIAPLTLNHSTVALRPPRVASPHLQLHTHILGGPVHLFHMFTGRHGGGSVCGQRRQEG